MVSRRSRIAGAVVLLGSTILVAALLLSSHRYGNIFRISSGTQATDPGRPTTDLFGDLLPDGAMARIGTVRLRTPHGLNHAAMSPDGKLLVTDGRSGELKVWDAVSGLELRTIETPEYVSQHPVFREGRKLRENVAAMAFAADSRQLNVMTMRGALRTCDMTTGVWSEVLAQTTRTEPDEFGSILAGSRASPDGTHFTYTRYEVPSSRVEVFAVGKDKPILQIEDPELGEYGRLAQFAPDNKRIAIALDHGMLKVWDLASAKVVRRYYGPDLRLVSFAFSPDWRSLAAVFAPHSRRFNPFDPLTLVSWDVVTQDPRLQVADWKGRVAGFSPDGKRLYSLNRSEVLVADAATGKPVGSLKGHAGGEYMHFAFAPDGRRMVTCGRQDSSMIIWDLETDRPALDFEGPRGRIETLAFSPDGETVFATGTGEQGCLWSARTGKLLHRLEVEGKESCASAAFTPDGKHIVVGYGWGGTSTTGNFPARMWSVEDGKLVREFPGHKDAVHHLAISPDGKQLATMDRGVELVRLWELDTGRHIRESRFSKDHTARISFPKPGDVVGIAPAAFSPGASRREAEIYRSHVMGGPPGGRWPIPSRSSIQALSHCGGFVAMREQFGIGNQREQIVIHVAGTGEVTKGLLVDRDAALSAVAFSPNIQYVAVGSHKRDFSEPTVHVFEMQTGREVRTLRGHRGPISALAFTPDGKKLATGSVDSTVLIWDLIAP